MAAFHQADDDADSKCADDDTQWISFDLYVASATRGSNLAPPDHRDDRLRRTNGPITGWCWDAVLSGRLDKAAVDLGQCTLPRRA
jgi:hypothetical protein